MTEQIKATLRDSKQARWIALVILSFTMFAGYMFTEIISPMKPILERNYLWDSADFGWVTSAYAIFNVFLLMLIIVGILLDKFGIRISTILSALLMIIGGTIKWYAFKGGFSTTEIINVFGFELKEQVFFAALGFAIFGVGVEYAGITVSKSVAKWFKGKEIALAMGMQVAIARLGSFAPLAFGAFFAYKKGVPFTIFIVIIFLILGLIGFFYYNIMDKKLDKQIGDQETLNSSEDDFKFSDLGVIVKNRGFWLIAFLCVLFYSAVFPFYKYGPDLMVNKFGVSVKWAGLLPSLVPFGTMLLTPFFGSLYDRKGKGASIMILGAVLLIFVHAIFFLPFINGVVFAFFNVIVLGIAFSLVPSAMWPSVPKIIPEKQLGSAYAFIFWVQNFGLWGIPLLVGLVLNSTNPSIVPEKKLVSDSFTKAYIEVLETSNIVGIKDANGDEIDLNDIAVFARSNGGDLIDKVIAEAPQEEVIEYNKEQLTEELNSGVKTAILDYLNKVDPSNINEIKDKELVVLSGINEVAINKGFEIIKDNKIKLNYDYMKTWSIFVVLTVLALFIAIWIKAEDKRKGYGLEKPNIQK